MPHGTNNAAIATGADPRVGISDLLACPFCGSTKITVEWEPCPPLDPADTNRRWFAECSQCSCQGPFCQKEPQVIAAWNARQSDREKALNYYRAAIEQRRPDFVPSRVRLPRRVTGDRPFWHIAAEPGEYDCESNQWGAICIRTETGQMLGVKPLEFEPVAWRANAAGQPRGE